MGINKEIMQAKIDARYASRELIRVVFHVTDLFPENDPEGMGPILRKKVLGISSFLSHGTVKSDRDEQNEDFLVVMGELREVLKLITIAHHLKYTSQAGKVAVRESIGIFIDKLDALTKLLGGFEK